MFGASLNVQELLMDGFLANPSLPLIMKAWSNTGRLSWQERVFNYWSSCASVVAENSFGRLKGCWRCLLKQNDLNLAMMPTIAAACTILHNMSESHTDKFDGEWPLDITQAQAQRVKSQQNVAWGKGEKIRTALAKYFVSNPKTHFQITSF